jgi:hypothetical protein
MISLIFGGGRVILGAMSEIDVVAVAAALADRNQLVAFAAMVLSCDRAVHAARMGYDVGGGGISYITATGVANSTGMSVAAVTQALRGLEAAGLALSDTDGRAWRPDLATLAGLAPSR